MKITDAMPDLQTLLELEAPELAGVILRQVCGMRDSERRSLLHLSRFTGLYTGQSRDAKYPEKHWNEINDRLAEAWEWLIANGLLAHRHDSDGPHGWVFITRLGLRVGGSQESYIDFRKAMALPKERLHATIAARCHSHFMRGLFDTAVFEAYKALEIAIREAAGYGPDQYGPVMARKAFGDSGPLRSSTAVPAEENGLAELMAGALGSYKNPHSHRNVAFSPAICSGSLTPEKSKRQSLIAWVASS